MNLAKTFFIQFFLFFITPALSFAGIKIHHDLQVTLNPATHSLEVIDKLTFPEELLAGSEIIIYLNESLVLDPKQDSTTIVFHRKRFPVPVRAYRLSLKHGETSVVLRYSGSLHHERIRQNNSAYAGNLGETAGMITPEGVFLAGASVWYPYVDAVNVSFSLKVKTPKGWKAVSQGERLEQTDAVQGHSVQWQDLTPQEEIYLIAAPFHEYSKAAGKVETMAFLRQDDSALANQYLDATAQYLEMYRQLIGPYAYSKFALVENLWESGYGMPSFTLLGSRVIRMPFILHSSYPHEILHNWWGNGVYVDYQQGNWAEGLTSYLADHLIQQQRGKAANYRRNILQNYADFVADGGDFPLADFTFRHGVSSEAIGYGKSQMFFHMLRQALGDEVFVLGLQSLYRQYQFKDASFDELQQVFESVSDDDLTPLFNQWIYRIGAPLLQLDEVEVFKSKGEWLLRGIIKQVQEGDAYRLTVPVAISLEGKEQSFQTNVILTRKQQPFSFRLADKPVRFDLDPEFDLFRWLNRAETPAALSQAFGADRVLFVLPSSASAEVQSAYEGLLKSWGNSQLGNLETVYDNVLTTLPDDRTVWVLGEKNLFAHQVVTALDGQGIGHHKDTISLTEGTFDFAQHSIVLTARRNNEDEHAMVWLAANRPQAISSLARKLPHYRKYSYLVFDGDGARNVIKGQWSVLGSPMSRTFGGEAIRMANLAPRFALAQLPVVID